MGHSDTAKPMFQGVERRSSIRVVYETVVMVANYDGANFPMYSSFWEVQTKDLSATGIGFVSDRQPVSDLVLLMLGNPQANPILTVARVAHCHPLENEDMKFKVGCEFVKRLRQ